MSEDPTTRRLQDLRREYLRDGLLEDQLAADPIDQFNRWLSEAIELDLGDDPTAMVLATVAPDGQPSQRTVLLKDVGLAGFVFYTNYGSRKAREIEHNANVSLLFPWYPLERQVIVSGAAEKLSVVESSRYFLSRPAESQLGAWASKQSHRISSRALLEEAFGQIKRRFAEGKIPVPSFWGGYRVRPVAIEFWQGRANRLHDRFLYQKQPDGDWLAERLQP